MSISAMKQALEALEWPLERLVNLCNNSASCSNTEEVIAAEAALERLYKARQAIAEAEKQEPVGYFSVNDYGNWQENESNYGTPLYIAPVHTSDISQEPVDEMAKNEHDDIYDIWVEQKLKEKNVPQS